MSSYQTERKDGDEAYFASNLMGIYKREGAEKALATYEEWRKTHAPHSFVLCSVATIHKQEGHIDLARAALEEAVAINPENPDPVILLNLARLPTENGKRKDDRELLETILKKYPNDSETLGRLGTIELSEGNKAKGIALLHKSLNANTDNVRTLIALSKVEKEEGNNGLNKILLERALRTDSDNQSLQVALTRVNSSFPAPKEDPKRAEPLLHPRDRVAKEAAEETLRLSIENTKNGIEYAERFLKKNPPAHPFVLTALGLAYKQVGEMEKADSYFAQANALRPIEDIIKLLNSETDKSVAAKMKLLRKNHYVPESITMGESYLKVNPEAEYVLTGLGSAYRMEKKYDLARAYFAKAMALDPKKPLVLVGMARVDFRDNKKEEARAWLDKALHIISDLRAEYGEIEKASDPKHLKKLQFMNADEADIYITFHDFALSEKDVPTARQYMEKAYAKAPEKTRVLNRFGELETLEGNINKARGYFNASLNQDPFDMEAVGKLAGLERKEGHAGLGWILSDYIKDHRPRPTPSMINGIATRSAVPTQNARG